MSVVISDARRSCLARATAAWLAVLLCLAVAQAQARGPTAPAQGEAAPALVATLFDGQSFDLAAQRGKVVVLNFWASWCGPCRAEMPELDALAREYRDRGLLVVGLSADDRHDRADALKAAGSLRYPLGMLSEATVNGFGAPGVLPLTYVISADGRIAGVVRAGNGDSLAELRAVVGAQMNR